MDCVFFINPKSGAGHGYELAKELDDFFFPSPIFKQVVFTDINRLSSQVFSLCNDKDLVVVCGGDGTVNAVVSELVHMDKVPPLAIIPLGTGNDIARGTGWLKSWEDFGLLGISHALRQKRVEDLDIWTVTIAEQKNVNSYAFLAYAGFGYDGLVCQAFSRLNSKLSRWKIPLFLKQSLYIPAGLLIFYKSLALSEKPKCSLNECLIQFGQLLFLNFGFYAGGSRLVKDSSYKDGIIECLSFDNYLSYLNAIFQGKIGRKPKINFKKGGHFSIHMVSSCHFQIDGEPSGILEKGTLLRIEPLRVIPLLRPILDPIAKEYEKEIQKQNALEPSAASPAITS